MITPHQRFQSIPPIEATWIDLNPAKPGSAANRVLDYVEPGEPTTAPPRPGAVKPG